MTLRSPIRWIGGKGRMISTLLPLFPAHETYVEPFGGAAALLLAKPPARVEVYNDIDSNLVGLFRALRDTPEDVLVTAALTPYARDSLFWARKHLDDAAQVMIAYRLCFGGKLSGYGIERTSTRSGMPLSIQNYHRAIERISSLSRRLRDVAIECGSIVNTIAIDEETTVVRADPTGLLARYDGPDTLFYLDPPYVASSWTGEKIYEHIMSDAEHSALLDFISGVKGMVLLSGYPNSLYEKLGWTSRSFATTCAVAARTDSHGLKGQGTVSLEQARTEMLWMNPAAAARIGSI